MGNFREWKREAAYGPEEDGNQLLADLRRAARGVQARVDPPGRAPLSDLGANLEPGRILMHFYINIKLDGD